MADDNRFDGLNDVLLARVEAMRDAFGEIKDATRLTNKILREVGATGSEVSEIYRDITRESGTVAELQNKAKTTVEATAKILQKRVRIQNQIRTLNQKINDLYERSLTASGKTRDVLMQQGRNLVAARDTAQDLADEFGKMADSSAELTKSTRFFTGLAEFTSKVPILKKFSQPFKDAAAAAKAHVLSNAKNKGTMSQLAAGGGSLVKSFKMVIKGATGFAAIALGIVKIVQFIVELFIGAQKSTVAIAKNLGISRDAAEVMRLEYVKIGEESAKNYVISTRLIESQTQLVALLGRGLEFSKETLLAQTFLTQRLGLAEATAAQLTGRFEAFGQNADRGVNSIIDLNNQMTKTGKSSATINQLLEEVASATGQIAASFGFDNIEIAKGVNLVRKYGLNLTQAKNISESLLDFETSIGNELEAELLTGKELNLEQARMKAVTGDIAGATVDVMKQMKGITKEQRKNPIIMKSLAATIGLSVDELQDAFMLETDRGRKMEERYKKEQEYIRKSQYLDKEGRKDLAAELKISEAKREELESQVTSGQAFGEVMDRVKDSFSQLVTSGALDILTDELIALGFWIGELTGANTRVAQENAAKAMKSGTTDKAIIAETLEAAKGSPWWMKMLTASSPFGPTTRKELAKQKLAQQSLQQMAVKDFVLKPLGEDTITMAGGTKLGRTDEMVAELKKNNELLTQLLHAKGDVYMDGNKVGRSLVLASVKSS